MTIYQTPFKRHQILDDQGHVLGALPGWVTEQPERLCAAYRHMVLIRQFDQKAIALQRTGKLGTYPSVLGQEAIGVAVGQAMQADDVLVPYYRDIAAQTLRGVSLTESLLYWGGDERGSAYANCPEDLPNCVPIATQLSHAAGVAAAFRIRGQHRAVVVTCGDGATSKGDFPEALNAAGVWHLPMVVIVNNNQWAISTPRSVQTASDTIAQKAVAAGIPGSVVDGNDYLALTGVIEEALSRARHGKGATLIEAQTYRLGDHTTADDATRYRPAEQLKQAWAKEPLARLRAFLVGHSLWDEGREAEWQQQVSRQIDSAVKAYLETPPEPSEALFSHLFADMPESLKAQLAEVRSRPMSSGAEEGGQ